MNKWTQPINIRFYGNQQQAEDMVGRVRKELGVLENLMSFQGLSSCQRALRFPDGSAIKARIINGRATVDIVTPGMLPVLDSLPYREEEPQEKKSGSSSDQTVFIGSDELHYGQREWILDNSLEDFVVVISTKSQQEAFAWDVATNSLLVEKDNFAAVLAALSEMKYNRVVEAVPTGFVESPGPNHERNLPTELSGSPCLMTKQTVWYISGPVVYYSYFMPINPDKGNPYFHIDARCFGSEWSEWDDWESGDTVVFETIEGSGAIDIVSENSILGVFASNYLTTTEIGAATETWTIEFFKYYNNLYIAVRGATVGLVGASGYFQINSEPYPKINGVYLLPYMELEDFTEPCAPYMWAHVGSAFEVWWKSEFEALTGVIWPEDPDWLSPTQSRDFLFFNHIFGVDVTNGGGSLSQIKATTSQVYDSWTDAEWSQDGYLLSTVYAWVAAGIASVRGGNIIFDAFAVYTEESRLNTGFHLFHRKEIQLAGAAQTILELVNYERLKAGLEELVPNANLIAAAKEQAQYMADNLYTGHTGSGGSTPEDRILSHGYLLYNNTVYQPTVYGENSASIDLGVEGNCEVYLDGGLVHQDSNGCSLQTVVDGWMASSGHRDVLLFPSLRETGIGTAMGSDGKTYICQVFGYRKGVWPGFAALDTAGILDYILLNFQYIGGAADADGFLRAYIVAGATSGKGAHEKIDKGPYVKPHESYYEVENIEHPNIERPYPNIVLKPYRTK